MSGTGMQARRRLWTRLTSRQGAAHQNQDLGQAAIVAVLVMTVLLSLIGALLVQTVVNSGPLQQTKSVEIYANRALEAGVNAYLTAVNANPSLAQCNTNENGAGTCSGINYGQWNFVENSNASGADPEYYAFGNPQPTINETTNALEYITVQVVGAAYDYSATNHYLFDQESITVSPANGFLENVWWSNFESYAPSGNYAGCNYNWSTAGDNPYSPTAPFNYNIIGADNNNGNLCSPVYFGPGDYIFGPLYSNDSLFVAGDGTPNNSPSFGNASAPGGAVPSAVTTADPNCQFVDSNTNQGMSGSHSNCANADNEVALYDTTNSSYGHSVEKPPADDAQLGTIASQNGCRYSGPTQITLSTNNQGAGQMTVVSPDTVESTVNGNTWDNDNIATNFNNCPNNGTAPLPPNGVVFVENATNNGGNGTAFANPLDDPVYNTVTNLASSRVPPVAGDSMTLTATVTSDSNQINNGATVSFSQTTKQGNRTSTSVINGCSTQTLSTPAAVVPATNPPSYTSTATCAFTESTGGTGAFSATYSGGNYTTSSSANYGQTYTLASQLSYGPYAQTTAGGCTSCYFGETGTPDAEGDAFVNGSLSGQLTIGTANNIIIDGNITYADCDWSVGQSGMPASSDTYCPYNTAGTNDSLGLIAQQYAEVGRPILASTSTQNNPTVAPSCAGTPAATCDPSNGGNGLTIDAAVLALTQSFVVNNFGTGGPEGNLNLYGSIQQFARGPVATFNNNLQIATGYQKAYTWDPRLDYISPPSYLVPSTPSWVLESVITNAGNSGTNVCPALLPVWGGSQPITQYCSQSPGGLPNYPTITAPDPPTNASATANVNGTATVTWTDPVSNNGSTINTYTVSISPPCSSCTGTTVTNNPTAVTTAIGGLTAGDTYDFSVTATNSSGTSDPSGASNAVTIPSAPAAPTNAAAATNANGSVTVSWTDPANNGAAITSYAIAPSPACAGCTYSNLSGASITSATVSGLTQDTSYTFKVDATNGAGTGPWSTASNSVTAPSVPGAPTITTVSAGNATVTVTWTAPASNGGSAITGYVVTPYIGATAQTPQTFTSTATTESVTGLTNGTAYTFKVAATNGVGTGSQSAASSSVTPATVPGAPTGVSGTKVASGHIQVSWTAPASNGGSAITGYVVTPYKLGQAQTPTTFNSTATTETVTGLTAGQSYTFKVAAINAIGTGAQSTASGSVSA